jgi:hypothetical protein
MARKSKAQAAPAEPMELEQVKTGGLGMDEGIMIATFLLLVGSCVLVYMAAETYAIPQ